ncbi:AMP-binding protein, partial [Actinoplanes philippinensis]|uniref:AMP-binding protein n=1 Tax=Actinoplanes philippinensis TaxID=35752 RepID=UPI0033DD4FCD
MDPAVQQRCADIARDLTIPALLHRNATEFPGLPALSMLGSAGTLTWRQLRDEVAVLARGLADLGLGSGDRLLIMMSGRPEHWLIDLAAASLGAIPSTVYATLSTDQLRYLARHSKAGIVVLEDDDALERWQPILDEVPGIRRVVVADRAASG